MTLLSLRARSPSPRPRISLPLPAGPSSQLTTSTPLERSPTIRLVTNTQVPHDDDTCAQFGSKSSLPRTSTLAPSSLSVNSRRPLVVKKTGIARNTTPLQPGVVEPRQAQSQKPSSGVPSRPSRAPILVPQASGTQIPKSTAKLTWNTATTYTPPEDWDVVQPQPSLRGISQPPVRASSRRLAVSSRRSTTPQPIAILPVKTNDGSAKENDPARISSASIRASRDSVRSNRTDTMRASGSQNKSRSLKVYTDENDAIPVLVKKKKSRLALDLGWALGDRTNTQAKDKDQPTPRASTPTLVKSASNGRLTPESGHDSNKEKDGQGKEKWKWSVSGMVKGRGRKENSTSRDLLPRRAKSPSPAPPAIRNIPTFAAQVSRSSTEYEYRSPSLDSYPPPPVPPVVPHFTTQRSVSAPLSVVQPQTSSRTLCTKSVSPPESHHKRSASSCSPLSPAEAANNTLTATRLHRLSDPVEYERAITLRLLSHASVSSPSNAQHASGSSNSSHEQKSAVSHQPSEAPKVGSLAIRAMRSVRSLARIGSWATLRGATNDEKEATVSRSKSKKRSRLTSRGSILSFALADPSDKRRDSTSSQESWEAGAPSAKEPSPIREKSVSKAISGMISLDKRIINEDAREALARIVSRSPEARPRASGDTFGTVHIGRDNGLRRASTLSSGSTLYQHSVTSHSRGSVSSKGSHFGQRLDSLDNDGLRYSLASSISDALSFNQSSIASRSGADSARLSGRQRPALTSIFDMSGDLQPVEVDNRLSVTSSRSSHSKRSSDSSGSRSSRGSASMGDSTSLATPVEDAFYTSRASFAIPSTLQTIPASPANCSTTIDSSESDENENDLTPCKPRTTGRSRSLLHTKPGSSVSKALGANAPPVIPALTLSTPLSMSCSDLGRRSVSALAYSSTAVETPVRAGKSRPRPMSEQLLGEWNTARKNGIIADNEEGDMAISLVSAATTDLGDLISRLDLSVTPECSPAKGWKIGNSVTPKRKSPLSSEDSPIPSLPGTIKKYHQRSLSASVADGMSSARRLPQLSYLFSTETPHAADISTFGRGSFVRPQLPVSAQRPTPIDIEPDLGDEEHSVPFPRLSTDTTATEDGMESPLKARGKLTALYMLSVGSKASMISTISEKAPKGSTGTIFSAFGPKETSQARRSLDGAADLSLAAVGGQDSTEEADDSDIPDELQEILSGKSDGGSPRAEHFYTLSNPKFAYTAMSREDLLSLAKSQVTLVPEASQSQNRPPTPAPSLPLPPRPSTSDRVRGQHGSHSSSEDGLRTPSAFLIALPTSSSSDTINQGGQADTTNHSIHEPSAATIALEAEEDADASSSDYDQSDDTGKTSFDFTRELNRLNEGGARQSFVEQLENAFRTPSKVSTLRSFVAPSESGAPALTFRDYRIEVENSKSGSGSTSRARTPVDLNSSTSSVAAIAESLIFSASATPTSIANSDPSMMSDTYDEAAAPIPQAGQLASQPRPSTIAIPHPEHVRASSLSESLEASMFALANLNLAASPNTSQSSGPRPHSMPAQRSASTKRYPRIAIARRKIESQRTESIATISSFESPNDHSMADPFNDEDLGFDEDACIALPPMPHNSSSSRALRHESVASFASISSFGDVLNAGNNNPFGYDLSRSTATRNTEDSPPRQRSNRFSVESGRSSFYFNSDALPLPRRAHRQSWARYQNDRPRDSIISNYSAARLGRPGLGDKMFDSGMDDDTVLSCISASPPSGEFRHHASPHMDAQTSFDSMISSDDRRSEVDSIFDRTSTRPTSVSSASLFGIEEPSASRQSQLPLHSSKHLRPVSMISTMSVNTTAQDDDTMVSMLGGERIRVPRGTLGSAVNGSPCVRAEKKRKRMFTFKRGDGDYERDASPTKARLVGQQSVAAVKFGHMSSVGAKLDRILGKSHSNASGDEFSTSSTSNIFNRPVSASFGHTTNDPFSLKTEAANPLIFTSAPPDTPPLSSASSAGGSQSSIDIERLKSLLEQASAPTQAGHRIRARGQGHRRPSSQVSRNSFIDTIVEESPGQCFSPDLSQVVASEYDAQDSVIIRDADSISDMSECNVDIRIDSLQKFYALRDEARATVEKSKVAWMDTDFSRYAISSYQPPSNPEAIQALIEHSQKTYVPLPLELRIGKPRSRANSRPSPYPMRLKVPRSIKRSISPKPKTRRSHARTHSTELAFASVTPYEMPPTTFESSERPPSPTSRVALSSLSPLPPHAPSRGDAQAMSKIADVFARPRLPTARRGPIGWARRKLAEDREAIKAAAPTPPTINSSSLFGKENKETEANGTLTSTANGSLRLSRARPPRPRPISILAPTAPSMCI